MEAVILSNFSVNLKLLEKKKPVYILVYIF